MTPERLNELLSQFAKHRIAVLGDFFLDKYLDIDPQLDEPSLETGRVAFQVVGSQKSPGAAGTVVNNLTALGAGQLHALGLIGDDGEGYDLTRAFAAQGCQTEGLIRSPEVVTPTYLKPRNRAIPGLAGEHSRYDTKNRAKTPSHLISQVAAALDHLLPSLDALVIMDQVELTGCGVVTSELRDILAEQALRYRKVIFWVDSRRHIRHFRNMITKPNQFEAVGRPNPLPGDEITTSDLRTVIPKMRAETGAPVFVSFGRKGMFVTDPELQLIPGVHVTGTIDPTGAGDSATAGAVLALCSGASYAEAALIANLVASVTVQQLGTTGTATPDQVRDALQLWRAQQDNGRF